LIEPKVLKCFRKLLTHCRKILISFILLIQINEMKVTMARIKIKNEDNEFIDLSLDAYMTKYE